MKYLPLRRRVSWCWVLSCVYCVLGGGGEGGEVVPGGTQGRIFVDECTCSESGSVDHVLAHLGLGVAFVGDNVDVSVDIVEIWAPDVIMKMAVPIAVFGAIVLAAFT